jgi:formimidoylglutamate deiminase
VASQPTLYIAPSALLHGGWADDVGIEVDAHGVITGIERSLNPGVAGIRLRGPVVPGMPNLHSHAFQRAMAGSTERSGPAGDSFWSWREQMYHFLDVLQPEHVEAIAAMLYSEMLEGGYTSVAEFHYLHHDPAGHPYGDVTEMAQRVLSAARRTGVGMTLLPVMYQYGGFKQQPAQPQQRRFVNDLDQFIRLIEAIQPHTRSAAIRLGIAPHSLRAVDGEDLKRLQSLLSHLPSDTPWHIHAAEQQQEVQQCVDVTGKRPVKWLLEELDIDASWCVVHATHMTSDETFALAQSRAVAGLCPSTEADLGDGLFDAQRYLAADGCFGIGGDSHVSTNPWFELQLFEYGQRLSRQRRNLLGGEVGTSVGGALYRRALAGGRRALAQQVGGIVVGAQADLVVLDQDQPSMFDKNRDELLDAAVFAPHRGIVKDVMTQGKWRVKDGRHVEREVIEDRYRTVMRQVKAR